MGPAIIAAIVGILTLIGTLGVQFYGIRRTSKDTLNARFATAADKLGSEAPAVRLAGVHAMAGLADDWEENRQTCIAVLCGYLRMPLEPDPGPDAQPPEQRKFQSSREVRWTLMRVITEHLRDPDAGSERKLSGVGKRAALESWRDEDRYFDFSGAVFDGGTFSDAGFVGGKATFSRAEFSCRNEDKVSFRHARFSDGEVSFHHAKFTGGAVDFYEAEFSGRVVSFEDAKFSGGTVSFKDAKFSDGTVSFKGAEFSGGTVSFKGAEFSGGRVDFGGAKFSGGAVDFGGAEFSGGELDFSNVGDWSCPPKFPWTDTPPPGVKLRRNEAQSQASPGDL